MPKVSVDWVPEFRRGELAELCAATEEAIASGIGFDWVRQPPRKTLEAFWRGVVLIPERTLMIGRLDDTIAGTLQMVRPAANNEAGSFNVILTSFFVAPWARGHGLARGMLREFEDRARRDGFTQVSLDVRETQTAAIALYESFGYTRWGIKGHYARVDNQFIRGFFYTKDLNA
ncbi:MAG: GNAT family N-acetyltransferase [Alphaproteobacteria bacterium]|nr:GNAT family N-acetyltransferase [Alphaproteobacteria bacterium]